MIEMLQSDLHFNKDIDVVIVVRKNLLQSFVPFYK